VWRERHGPAPALDHCADDMTAVDRGWGGAGDDETRGGNGQDRLYGGDGAVPSTAWGTWGTLSTAAVETTT
jgi:hypothetical protein